MHDFVPFAACVVLGTALYFVYVRPLLQRHGVI